MDSDNTLLENILKTSPKMRKKKLRSRKNISRLSLDTHAHTRTHTHTYIRVLSDWGKCLIKMFSKWIFRTCFIPRNLSLLHALK